MADDLDLESKTQPAETTNVYIAPPSDTESAQLIREAPNRSVQQGVSRLVNTVVGTFLVILVFVLISVVSDPQSFFTSTLRSLESSEDNSIKRVLPVQQDTSRQMTNAEADNPSRKNSATEFKWNQPMIIQYGSTIYEIANNAYGANTILGMDLIKDFNPQIKDLNWISAGQDLILPALTRETLVRQHGDGSYRFIVASYIKRTEADELASRIAQDGYQVTITRKRVSSDLLLHRLEIDGLRTPEEVTKTLKTGLKKKWFTLSGHAWNTE